MDHDPYGLTDRPFQLTPDPRFYFESATHRKAMTYLGYGLAQGEGFIVVTGEVGTGKTMLVGRLMATIDRSRLTAINLVSTQLEGEDILRIVALALGVAADGAAKGQLLARIERFLHEQARGGKRTLLIVDEAQNLPISALEELRMLSNFQFGGQALLQIFLLGQPEFREALAQPRFEQLRQRVIATHNLTPMGPDEVAPYVMHRLACAGWKGTPRFTQDAYEAFYRLSGGIPRRLNMLAGRVMLQGAIERLIEIDGEVVEDVAADLASESIMPADGPQPLARAMPEDEPAYRPAAPAVVAPSPAPSFPSAPMAAPSPAPSVSAVPMTSMPSEPSTVASAAAPSPVWPPAEPAPWPAAAPEVPAPAASSSAPSAPSWTVDAAAPVPQAPVPPAAAAPEPPRTAPSYTSYAPPDEDEEEGAPPPFTAAAALDENPLAALSSGHIPPPSIEQPPRYDGYVPPEEVTRPSVTPLRAHIRAVEPAPAPAPAFAPAAPQAVPAAGPVSSPPAPAAPAASSALPAELADYAARNAELEARLAEQEAILRRTLSLLVELVEMNDVPAPAVAPAGASGNQDAA